MSSFCFHIDQILYANFCDQMILKIKPLPEWINSPEIVTGKMYGMLLDKEFKSFTFLSLVVKNKLLLREYFTMFYDTFHEVVLQISSKSLRNQLKKMEKNLKGECVGWFARRFVCFSFIFLSEP